MTLCGGICDRLEHGSAEGRRTRFMDSSACGQVVVGEHSGGDFDIDGDPVVIVVRQRRF